MRSQRITPEAVAAFKAAMAGRPVYIGCIRDVACESVAAGRHCQRCKEYLAACKGLQSSLGLTPWNWSPAEVELDAAPPAWLRDDQVADFRAAQELRRQLEAAS